MARDDGRCLRSIPQRVQPGPSLLPHAEPTRVRVSKSEKQASRLDPRCHKGRGAFQSPAGWEVVGDIFGGRLALSKKLGGVGDENARQCSAAAARAPPSTTGNEGMCDGRPVGKKRHHPLHLNADGSPA